MPAAAGTGEQLPDTASEMPLLALAGLMTIAAGLVLRELRRRDV
jgi:LPXTG-motif cell wall-anchored protein